MGVGIINMLLPNPFGNTGKVLSYVACICCILAKNQTFCFFFVFNLVLNVVFLTTSKLMSKVTKLLA